MTVETKILNPVVNGAYYHDEFDMTLRYKVVLDHDDYGISIKLDNCCATGVFNATVDYEVNFATSDQYDECFSDLETKEISFDLKNFKVVCEYWSNNNESGVSFENVEIDLCDKIVRLK